jgi:flagellar motor switch protein FliM
VNTQHSFVAERAAAQHCAELLRCGPAPAELLPALARAGERIANTLAPVLGGLIGGAVPSLTSSPPEQLGEDELAREIGPLAANFLLGSSASGISLLASIEGQAVLRLVDRAFGGKGDSTGQLPDRFPLSAVMMIGKLEEIVSRCLGEVLGLSDLTTVRHDSSLTELAPFTQGTAIAVLRFTVTEDQHKPWQLLVALPLAQLLRLFGTGGLERPAPRRSGAADPAAAPFAAMPLPLTATLVDMRVPLSVLAALAPGAVLPVAVARAVPISIGGTVLARGTIGSNDDRVAVKLTQIA